MLRFRNFRSLAAAALVGVAMLALGSPARAGFTLTLKTDGQADQTFNLISGQLNSGTATIGAYSVQVSARDTAPGISVLFGGALVSQNTFAVSATGTQTGALEIIVQDDTFSSAPYNFEPITVKNSLSTTEISNGTVTANGFLNGLSTANLMITGPTLSGSVANSASSIMSLGSTFTLGNSAIVAFTGNGAGEANFTVTTLAPLAVPEPASLVACLTGLPLGIGAWMRRRRRMG